MIQYCESPASAGRDYIRFLLMPRPYSRSRIDRAGDFFALRKDTLWPTDKEQWPKAIDAEWDIFSTFRSLHALPLKIISDDLAERTSDIDPSATFGQRLKRFASIQAKLRREPHMQLTTMQDIAGCRAVVASIKEVYALSAKYQEQHSLDHPHGSSDLVSKWTKDYIREPKEDGYRSLHFVRKFKAQGNEDLLHLDDLRVEMQIRSRLQHAWAMAVETASAVTNQALKSGSGQEDWKTFFILMGEYIAYREGSYRAALNIDNVYSRAKELATNLRVITLLEGMSHVVENFSGSGGGADDFFLMVLDTQNRGVRYRGFKNSQYAEAVQEYSREELVYKDNGEVHVLLVAVSSLGELKTAYPSYFLDSEYFVSVVKDLFRYRRVIV